MELSSVVVVPARDEAGHDRRLPARAGRADRCPREAFETIVVLDACQRRHRRGGALGRGRARPAAADAAGPGPGAGAARRAGMEAAAERLLRAGPARRPDRLHRRRLAAGARLAGAPARPHSRAAPEAIAGLIELDPAEAGGASRRRCWRAASATPPTRLRRVRRARARGRSPPLRRRLARASPPPPTAPWAVSSRCPALEDAAFADRLREHGIPILRPADVRVRTSARADGRAARGLSVDLEVSIWSERDGATAPTTSRRELLAAGKGDTTVTVIIPTKDCAETIGGVLRETVGAAGRCWAWSTSWWWSTPRSEDGTAGSPPPRGARVLQQDELVRRSRARRSARAMRCGARCSVTGGDVVCFLDGDTGDPQPSHLQGLLGPMLTDPRWQLVKGAFDRPLQAGGRAAGPRGRPGDRADGPAAAQPARAAAGRLRPAAGRRVRGPAGAAGGDPVPGRLRGRDRGADRRAAPVRARRAGRMPSRQPPEPSPAATSAGRDGLRGPQPRSSAGSAAAAA